jgi:hypothetical protein
MKYDQKYEQQYVIIWDMQDDRTRESGSCFPAALLIYNPHANISQQDLCIQP